MTIYFLLTVLFDVCLFVTVVVGWRYGGASERWGVAIVGVGSLVTFVLMGSSLFDWRTHRIGLIAIDAAALVALVILMLRSTRFWPIWATAFHLIALCSHGVIYVLPRALLQTYAIFQGFWIYPIMACIVGGALSHRAATIRHDRAATQHGAPPT